MFSHLFGLHPWDIARLTVAERGQYKSWADDWLKQQQNGGR